MREIASQTCLICGGKAERLIRPVNTAYYHCDNCDLVFLDEKHYVPAADEIKRYKFHNNSLDNEGYVSYLRDFISSAQIDQMKCRIRALDYGCGPDPVLMALLRQAGINEVDIYDPYFFTEKSFINKKYDLITCTEVLEHMKDPLGTMFLLQTLLSPGGFLATKTLYHTTPGGFEKWWYRQDPTHICFYSPKTMRWLGDRLGFAITVLDGKSICVFQGRD